MRLQILLIMFPCPTHGSARNGRHCLRCTSRVSARSTERWQVVLTMIVTSTDTDILDRMYTRGKWPLSPKAFILPIFSLLNLKGMQLRRGCRRLGRNLHDGNAGRQVNNFATLKQMRFFLVTFKALADFSKSLRTIWVYYYVHLSIFSGTSWHWRE